MCVAEAVGSVLVFGDADAHALELSHVESVPGTCVDWAGTLSAHQSLHVSVGAGSLRPIVLPRCIDVYFLNGVCAGISRVQF